MTIETGKIEANKRDQLGSRYANRLRKAGRLPAVIYGRQQDALHVAFDEKIFMRHIANGLHVFEVAVDAGSTEIVLVREIQYDYLGDTPLHVDMTRVSLDDEATGPVAIRLSNQEECSGVKDGGILEHQTSQVNITCPVVAFPDSITVNVGGLKIGETVTIKDLPLAAGSRTDDNPDTVVVTVRNVKEVAETEVAASAEPEVLTGSKKED